MEYIMMSGQKYKRTNFEEDEMSGAGTPPPRDMAPGVMFQSSLGIFRQRRTPLECTLVVILGLATLAIVVLASLIAVKDKQLGRINTNVKTVDKGPCLTPKCVMVASSLLSAMDRTVDPCEDFFMYSCGGWIKSHVIPSGHSRWNTFSELWQQNQIVMKRVIEMPSNFSHGKAEEKAKKYYQSCMDKNKTIESLGPKPMLDFVRSLGGWGISDSTGVWSPANFSLQTALEKTKVFGVLFAFFVGADDKNSSVNILQFDQGGLGLSNRDLYLNETYEEILNAYLDYMTKVGVLMGGEENNTRQQMREVIDFETTLAEITVPSEERRDEEKIYHKMTIQELQGIAPFINWLQLINNVIKVASLTMTGSDHVVVYVPEFFQNLTSVVQNVSSQVNGKRTLQNYMIWQVVKTMTPYMSKPFRDARKILTEAMSGISGGEELWRYCITDTNEVLGFALGAMFVREAFKGDNKEKAEAMIQQIKIAFKGNLPNLAWMDAQTRAAAIDKANAVVDMIGFPEYILNTTRLDAEYKGLELNASEYFKNNVRNLYFQLKADMELLKKAPESNVWDMTPPSVNAYYTPLKNEIAFPAGILQAPFYDRNYPKSLNFGAIGVVMGHELTHGFDDKGRGFDKTGNLRPWWNNASITRFQEKTQCMIDQYSSYEMHGQHIKGKQTLGENIADNGGLKAAYHAYENWVSSHGEEIPLPGLNLTHRQIFFLGFSQVWCSVSTKEADKLQIIEDPHSPFKFRVIGTLSNSYDFAQLYKCPKGSPMNPEKKCVIW